MTNPSSNTYGPSAQSSSYDGDGYAHTAGGAINQYVIFVRCYNIQDSTLRHVHITSYNELLPVSFPIGIQQNAATVS